MKISAGDLVAAEWGDSEQLDVGAMVWAVGSPFGLQRSITFGILSAKNRVANTPLVDFLQTDAAVNPGNSGGPLVDVRGRVIGINTAIIGEAYQGISFAIPSAVARQTYEELKARGSVRRGWLGVQLEDLNEQLAREFRVKQGALVTHLVAPRGQASPAQQAGMRPGDVIVRWNQHPIPDRATLIRQVAVTTIGSQVDVVVVRSGQPVSLKVQVGLRPAALN